jgi:hypothetical protein
MSCDHRDLQQVMGLHVKPRQSSGHGNCLIEEWVWWSGGLKLFRKHLNRLKSQLQT